jgi:nucleoside diphosphate kinase
MPAQQESTSKMEQTLAIIKPDAVKHRDEIVVRVQKAGFTISEVSRVCTNDCDSDEGR